MKNIALFLLLSVSVYFASCSKKDENSENFKNITGVTWHSDSLLVNGIDASNAFLKSFVGDAKFNADGSGTFGKYTGTWQFLANETQLLISSDSLTLGFITTTIAELTKTSLKVTTIVPDFQNLSNQLKIRMTFKPK